MDTEGEVIILYTWLWSGGVARCVLLSDRGREEKEVGGYSVDGKANNIDGEEVNGKASNGTPPICLYQLRIEAK